MSQSYDLYNQANYIMNRFDFMQVQIVMQALNWKWAGEAPTLNDLKHTAEMLLTKVQTQVLEDNIARNWVSWSTGGFEACGRLVNGNWILSLRFIVEKQDGAYA